MGSISHITYKNTVEVTVFLFLDAGLLFLGTVTQAIVIKELTMNIMASRMNAHQHKLFIQMI